MSDVSSPPFDAPAPLSELRDDSLTDRVFDAVRAAITSKALPPGSHVTEQSLAAQLNVSKTPVREALLRLRQVGLIEPDGRRGGRVVLPSRRAIEDAYEVREALESFAARAAADRATPAQREQVSDAAARSLSHARATNFVGFNQADDEFHTTLIEAAASPRIAGLLEDTYALIVTLRSRDVPDPEDSIACGTAHVAIADAIASRDADAAERRMRDHVAYVKTFVLAALGEQR
jgi:DNA-binding GntR family transcriptional regulator